MKNIKIGVGIMSLTIIASMLLASCSKADNIADKSNDNSDNIKYITECFSQYAYKSIEELVLKSEMVVRAKFVDTMPSVERNDEVVTDHIFEISEVYSGDKKAGDKITVERFGGILGDTKYKEAGDNRELKVGEEVILILYYPKDGNDEICSTDYYVYYPPNGIYFKNDETSAKDGEQFVANDSSTLNLSTIQAQINDIFTASKADKPNENSDNIKYITEYSFEYVQRSIEELVLESELVVRAKFVDTMPSERRNDDVVTDHIFEISEVYSGDKKAGDKITVERFGGILGDTKYKEAGDNRELKVGEEVILILSYPKDGNNEICSTDYYVYYPIGGIYYKSDEASAKDGEQFVAFYSKYKFNTSTIQAQINDIFTASKAELE